MILGLDNKWKIIHAWIVKNWVDSEFRVTRDGGFQMFKGTVSSRNIGSKLKCNDEVYLRSGHAGNYHVSQIGRHFEDLHGQSINVTSLLWMTSVKAPKRDKVTRCWTSKFALRSNVNEGCSAVLPLWAVPTQQGILQDTVEMRSVWRRASRCRMWQYK